jgi:hypothetical protein
MHTCPKVNLQINFEETPPYGIDGAGPDKSFLSALYGDLAAGKLGKIDTSAQAVIGYSSGAYLVSRLLATFPGIASVPTSTSGGGGDGGSSDSTIPSIRAAVMLCGGSYRLLRTQPLAHTIANSTF